MLLLGLDCICFHVWQKRKGGKKIQSALMRLGHVRFQMGVGQSIELCSESLFGIGKKSIEKEMLV